MPDTHTSPDDAQVAVVARLTLKEGREGDGAELESAFADYRAQALTMPGIRAIALLPALDRPGAYVSVTVWQDGASFRNANTQPAFTVFRVFLKEIVDVESDSGAVLEGADALPALLGAGGGGVLRVTVSQAGRPGAGGAAGASARVVAASKLHEGGALELTRWADGEQARAGAAEGSALYRVAV
ncbi:antibiotic biosynthesis monooxygenase family protein [Streptomyces sp. WAC 01529]|uniref:antibiotic biosynthesis monooxygenase family protein n=1 Tax=Streptomyces sp. WAC 01529 TaxID=2203205 RepID=UPI0013DFF7A5|nr:antibiotic biosynthesis monooxygenase family protein [Streptomyces sp. WAC 01529]